MTRLQPWEEVARSKSVKDKGQLVCYKGAFPTAGVKAIGCPGWRGGESCRGSRSISVGGWKQNHQREHPMCQIAEEQR